MLFIKYHLIKSCHTCTGTFTLPWIELAFLDGDAIRLHSLTSTSCRTRVSPQGQTALFRLSPGQTLVELSGARGEACAFETSPSGVYATNALDADTVEIVTQYRFARPVGVIRFALFAEGNLSRARGCGQIQVIAALFLMIVLMYGHCLSGRS